MKDSTRDKICKSPQYVQKKSQYSIYQQKKKKKEIIIFSIYTRSSKISPKLIVSLIWSQKLQEGEKQIYRLTERWRIVTNQQPHADSPLDCKS